MSAVTGSIRLFKSSNGYGFLKPDSGGRDVFFLVKTALAGGITEPREGMRVEFDVEVGERGPRALSMKEIGNAE